MRPISAERVGRRTRRSRRGREVGTLATGIIVVVSDLCGSSGWVGGDGRMKYVRTGEVGCLI